jgi:uncharacterized ion transporter superfamily protein YfcC
MNLICKFFLATIPVGISIIFLSINKSRLDNILLKHDSSYVSKRNSSNIARMLKAYKNCSSLDKKERRILVLAIFFILIIYLTVVLWGVITLFFPDLFF